MTRDERLAGLSMAAFAVLWVFVESVLGSDMEQRYPLMQVVWCRYATHLSILLVLFWPLMRSRLFRTERPVLQLSRSMMMLVMPLSFVGALQVGMPAGNIWALFWVAPLMVLAMARPLLGERVSPGIWGACLAGAVATVLMLGTRQVPNAAQVAIVLAMAGSFALYVVMTRMLRDEPCVTNLLYSAVGVFVVLTPFMPAIWVWPTPHDLVRLAGIGAFGLLALLALDRAAARAPVSRSVSMLFVHMPALSAIAWLTEGTAPSLRVLGGILIIAATVVLVAKTRPPIQPAINGSTMP